MMKIVRTSLCLLVAALSSVKGHVHVLSDFTNTCVTSEGYGRPMQMTDCGEALLWNMNYGEATSIYGDSGNYYWDVDGGDYVVSGDPPGDQWMVPSSNAGTIRLSGTSYCATVENDGTLSMRECYGDIRQRFSFY